MAEAAHLDVVVLEVVNPPCAFELDGNLGRWAVSQGANGLLSTVVESGVAKVHSP